MQDLMEVTATEQEPLSAAPEAVSQSGEADASNDASAAQSGENGEDISTNEAEKENALVKLLQDTYGLAEGDDAALAQAFRDDRARDTARQQAAINTVLYRGAMGEYCALLAQADALRSRYPGFDLPALCRDKRFTALLSAGAEMEEAYTALHQKQLLQQAIWAAGQYGGMQARQAMLAAAARPREGAMGAGSTAIGRANPADMTRAQREAIARRVMKGEKVFL